MKNPLLIFPPPSSHKSEIDQIEDQIRDIAGRFGWTNPQWPFVDAMFNKGMEYGNYLTKNGWELKPPKLFDIINEAYGYWEEELEGRTSIGNSLKELFRSAVGLELRSKDYWNVDTPLSGPAPVFDKIVENYFALKSNNFCHDSNGNFRWFLHFEPNDEDELRDIVSADFQACIANPDKQDNLLIHAIDWNTFCDNYVTIEFDSNEFYEEEFDATHAADWLEEFIVMAKLKIP